jgi:hypothetical protein
MRYGRYLAVSEADASSLIQAVLGRRCATLKAAFDDPDRCEFGLLLRDSGCINRGGLEAQLSRSGVFSRERPLQLAPPPQRVVVPPDATWPESNLNEAIGAAVLDRGSLVLSGHNKWRLIASPMRDRPRGPQL